ncbi:Regulatory protein AfsR [Nonomuraea coxensis DSM 45129]|uniref:Regulatory protein AfsR n=1 Tax=Nonomuraea coxensis DSM 45129 TaxID=1122611 RepID=A0ABX8U8Y9_9ACTN|nr:BTAD domain-containing putative transcriptional regulator [Nonomuraea coxensis]QYC44230.1 Regulatory protein AfsR [Nonomuraea coxensis DSM 45129]
MNQLTSRHARPAAELPDQAVPPEQPVTIRLLGPLDVVLRGRTTGVSGIRRRTALATLALRAGETVSTERLIDVVWGGSAPATAVNTLQSHISYLRRLLGVRTSIVTRATGYALDAGAFTTDVLAAERLVEQARQAADPAGRAARLREALALWRGRPLDDLSVHPWLEEQAARLARIRMIAVTLLIAARLDLGEHAALIPELEDLTRRHPFDEDLHRQLMLALYRTGRQADALALYHRLRCRLGEELGIAPGRPLQALEEAILRHDVALDPPASPSGRVTETARVIVPAQLPPGAGAIAGRLDEMGRLDLALGRKSGSPAILAVVGMAGVGKTALAVHWAHRAAERFPDGQLYVNLLGFDPSHPAMDPADALRGFLYALTGPPHTVPVGLTAQVGLYRSLLAGKRVLVVLDNARDAAHVRPLLPSSPGCAAVVTSRTQLTPLVITEGAYQLTLGPLPPAESYALLADRVGKETTAAEPEAAGRIVEQCGGLPLALAIAAAQSLTYPARPLTRLAAHLQSSLLDTLTGGDPTTDLRAVFSWSYRSLSSAAATLFRGLGSLQGVGMTALAAAELAGLPVHLVRPLLDELVGAHLLNRLADDRYALHELLKAYAAELWQRQGPTSAR